MALDFQRDIKSKGEVDLWFEGTVWAQSSFLWLSPRQAASGICKWRLLAPPSVFQLCNMNGSNQQGEWKLPVLFHIELYPIRPAEPEGKVRPSA